MPTEASAPACIEDQFVLQNSFFHFAALALHQPLLSGTARVEFVNDSEDAVLVYAHPTPRGREQQYDTVLLEAPALAHGWKEWDL